MSGKTRIGIFLLFLSFAPAGFAETRSERTEENRVRMDQLVNACVQSQIRDKMCDTLVQAQQLGLDAVETIKSYVHMGPFEYAVLTAANFATSGRLRVKTQPIFVSSISNTLEYRRDGTLALIFEKDL